jgi:hypothetical protein
MRLLRVTSVEVGVAGRCVALIGGLDRAETSMEFRQTLSSVG